MLQKLTQDDPEKVRRRYKIVRADSYADVEPNALILEAYVETGLCTFVDRNGSHLTYDFRPGGLRILPAR